MGLLEILYSQLFIDFLEKFPGTIVWIVQYILFSQSRKKEHRSRRDSVGTAIIWNKHQFDEKVKNNASNRASTSLDVIYVVRN